MENKAKTPVTFNHVPAGAKSLSTVKKGIRATGSQGFTLVELLAVVGILGVLAIVAMSAFYSYTKLAKISRGIADIRSIDKMINAYELERGILPVNLSDLGSGSFTDAWGNPYKYYNIINGGGPDTPYLDETGINKLNTTYDLYSMGADGQTARELTLGGGATSQDDIIRVNDGSKVKLGSRFL
jgi:general secretion pathway protein G